MERDKLTEKIIGCAYKVHNILGYGFMEKVYENALKIELEKAGLNVKQQIHVKVFYEDIEVGVYCADLLINDELVIELKALEKLHIAHEVQLVNYLNAIKIDKGLLINFGLSVEIKRKHRFKKEPV